MGIDDERNKMSTEKLTVKSQGANTYKVKYSKFDGDITIKRDRNRISEVVFRSSDGKKPVSAGALREFPLGAVETIIANKGNAEPLRKRPLIKAPNGARLTPEFYDGLSEFYLDALTRNERPLVAISEATGAPHNTVARWVARAREEGYLK
jgi:hypothetical protein